MVPSPVVATRSELSLCRLLLVKERKGTGDHPNSTVPTPFATELVNLDAHALHLNI